jgi:Fe-S-cluster containining protein
MASLCDKCVALCCRYFALEIDAPETAREYDNIRWYLMHENVIIYIEDKRWFLGVLTRCKNLQPDNRCGIYHTRPQICRGYTTDNCDYHGGDYGFDKLFTSAEELEAYAKEQLKSSRKRRRTSVKRKRQSDGRLKVQLPVM